MTIKEEKEEQSWLIKAEKNMLNQNLTQTNEDFIYLKKIKCFSPSSINFNL